MKKEIFYRIISLETHLRTIFCFLLLAIVAQNYAYGQQLSQYSQKVFQSEFNDEDKAYWSIKEQPDFKHFISEGNYVLKTTIGAKRFYTGLRFNKIPESFLVSTDLRFITDNSLWGSIGIVIGAKNKLDEALLIQFDKKGRIRLATLEGSENIKVLSQSKIKTDYGWLQVAPKLLGDWNNIKVLVEGNNLLLYIENKQVYTYALTAGQAKGNVGFYAEGPINVEVDKFSIFSKLGAVAVKEDFSPDKVADKDIVKETEGSTKSGDVVKLASALSDLKKENAELQEQMEELKIENKLIKGKEIELQQTLAKYQEDVKTSDFKKLKDDNQKLSKENEMLRNEVAELQQYKKLIKGSKDADLVIVLTENLKKEQKTNAELKEKIKKITSEKKK